MTSRVLFTFLVGLLAVSAFGADKSSPQELLDAAHKNADLSSLGSYILTGMLVVNPGKKEQTGTVALYRDHDRVRVDFQIAGRTETRISIGQKDYVEPAEILVAGTWLTELDRLWDPERPAKGVSHPADPWKAPSSRKIDGIAAWCLERDHNRTDKLCFDASRNLLLTSTKHKFSDYTALGPAFFPKQITITEPDSAPMEVRDIKVNVYPAEDKLFEIPAQAMELENCEEGRPPQPVDTQLPPRSEEAMVATRAKLALYIFIDKQGQVAEIKILSLVAPGYDAGVLGAVKKWRFKPAMCGAKPVNFAMLLEVSGRSF
jgi:hypothetical protein